MKHELRAGTSFRGIAMHRAEPTGDAKKMLAELQTAWSEFQAKNDERLAAIEAGTQDVVREEEVNRINASIGDITAKLEELALAAAGRDTGGNGNDREDEDRLRAFARAVGQPDLSQEDFSAYNSGLETYFRRGAATPREVMAALSVGSDPDGGYTVPPDMTGRIARRIYETSPMRQVAYVVTIGTDKLEGFNDLDEAGAGWVGETATRSETTTPDLGKWDIPVNEVFAEPKATQKLLEDSAFDIEGWLADKVADRMARVENTAFINGDGALKPRGLLNYPTVATADAARAWGKFQHINTGASGAFPASNPVDKLVDLMMAVKAGYRNNAAWMMARSTLAEIRKLKNGTGDYLWQPDLEQSRGGLLLGHRTVEAEDMPALGANSLSIAFGNFNEAYTIVERLGLSMLRDPYTQKGFVKFYSRKRVGGGATNFEAVKFLRFGS